MTGMRRALGFLLNRAERLTEGRHLTGAAIFRIVAGANTLLVFLLNYPDRGYLFGPDGIVEFSDFTQNIRGFSLYSWSESVLWFELVFHAGILAAMLWMLGVWPLLLTPVTYVLWYSLYERNTLIWDGGDNIMAIMFVYAMFMRLDAGPSLTDGIWARAPEVARRLRNLFHNLAVLCAALQLSIVYAVSGLSKVQGETWQNGTALYYVLQSAEFSLPGVSDILFYNGALLAFVCYVTVFFLIGFPALVFLNRRTRVLAVIMGITFHLGIGVLMGLVSFALFMIAAELLLISDAEYRWIGTRAKALASWTVQLFTRTPVVARNAGH